MSSRFLVFVSLIGAVLLALACGGGGSSATPTTVISGSLDTASLSKPRFVGTSALTGTAYRVGSSSSYTVTVQDDGSYTVTVAAGVDIDIEIKSGSTTVLSRVLPSSEVVAGVLTKNINALTHVQARLALAAVNSAGSLTAALTQANTAIFGSSTTVTSAMLDTLATGLLSVDSDEVVAIVATYQQLASTALTADLVSAMSSLTSSLDALTTLSTATIKGAFTGVLNSVSTSDLVAQAIGSAYNAIQSSSSVLSAITSTGVFTQISSDVTNGAFTETALYAPVYATPSEPNTVAPGVMLQYTFAAETTQDALGIGGYTGGWVTTTP
ncbi:MAG: hypothetical protein HQL31_03860, partial [Planctomycetes bacterium]|nr:hypothetical protein [Planctomycetota bacterium]